MLGVKRTQIYPKRPSVTMLLLHWHQYRELLMTERNFTVNVYVIYFVLAPRAKIVKIWPHYQKINQNRSFVTYRHQWLGSNASKPNPTVICHYIIATLTPMPRVVDDWMNFTVNVYVINFVLAPRAKIVKMWPCYQKTNQNRSFVTYRHQLLGSNASKPNPTVICHNAVASTPTPSQFPIWIFWFGPNLLISASYWPKTAWKSE